MPSSTPKQKRTMAAAAHDPAFADKMGIPQSVARDFNRADTKKSGGGLNRGPYVRNYCAGGKVISSSGR